MGMDIWGKFISLRDWGPLVDDLMEHPDKGPLYNLAPPEVDDREYDAIFIGGGAAGRFGAAFMKARGGRPLVIDKWPFLGGSCPHEACVPHHVFSEAAKELDYARFMGGTFWYPKWDPSQASILEVRDAFLGYRNAAHGIMNFQSKEQLGLEFVLGAPATVVDRYTVEADGKRYTAKNLVLCTGARPMPPDIAGLDKHGVIDWSTILYPDKFDFEPTKCVVIGGGKTSIEYGSFINATGCHTTILTRSPLLRTPSLHHVDEDIRQYVKTAMEMRDIEIVEGAHPVEVIGDGRVTGVRYRDTTGDEQTISCDLVFLGTGERAMSAPFIETLGVEVDDKGRIVVDKTMRTSVENVYATGDLIDGPMEMFKARKSGVTASKNIMGEYAEFDYSDYADFLHSTYEMVWTGLSEEEARAQYDNVVVIQMPPKGVPHEDCTLPAGEGTMFFAVFHPEKTGMFKSIIDGDTRKILGLHFVGHGVKNAFQYLDYLLKRPEGLTADQLADVNELFLNDGYPQLHRLRAGSPVLRDL